MLVCLFVYLFMAPLVDTFALSLGKKRSVFSELNDMNYFDLTY